MIEQLFVIVGALTGIFFGVWFIALYAKMLWLMMKNGWNRL